MSQQPSRAASRLVTGVKVSAVAVLLAACSAAVAQTPQGTPSMEERLRTQLRATTEQLQQAQNELAALKAGGATPAGAAGKASKDSPEALRKALDDAQQQLAAERQARERLSLDARACASEVKTVADKANAQIAQYRNAYDELLKLARQADAQRKQLAQETDVQRAALKLASEKNDRLYAVGQEILTAYETMDVATVVAARQPFATQARVKYEQIAQQYGDKLYEGKFDEQQAIAAASAKPGDAPAASAAPADASAPTATK
ncbi:MULTISPECIES: hypothetical protein [Pandoraea]|uniref:hypothetical protein n=1 Tax=Pandoraea TaxID=93217 RepID=UPI001F5D6882|nr:MULTISPECIES: hypothetical protein [Pandoraea]MCI3203571.1 hypothetical protein [Pandoraea sp. LA3]MDN4581597.1 hypothetical protein [Pandoraea capi]